MAIVGVVALVLVALIILGGLYVGMRSIPDLRRYRRIRKMSLSDAGAGVSAAWPSGSARR